MQFYARFSDEVIADPRRWQLPGQTPPRSGGTIQQLQLEWPGADRAWTALHSGLDEERIRTCRVGRDVLLVI